jgi:hypothetical protein
MIRRSMAVRALSALLTAALSLVACQPRDPVLLKLDGAEVRRSDFERHLAAVEASDLSTLRPGRGSWKRFSRSGPW